jgi:predicted pyridoxine 5'-phosphate oxidase superfamily flavin-nucleotide-binding protein
MRRVLDEQRLGFIATVTPEGRPNLSPKGTTTAWDDDHLVFADICSPRTIANLRANPAIEINVVDPILRKGWRFRGSAEIIEHGPRFEEIMAFYRSRGSRNAMRAFVLMKVEATEELISPAYDLGQTEAEVSAFWESRRDDLRRRRESP